MQHLMQEDKHLFISTLAEKYHMEKGTTIKELLMSTLVDLEDMTEKPKGVHNINTKLFSISFHFHSFAL